MPQSKISGYVIRGISTGETSRVVTVFTFEYGKIKCMAKGAKKSATKKGVMLGLFSQIQGQIYRKEHSEMATLGSHETVIDYADIALDPVKYGFASAYCEILDRSTQTDQPQPELYQLTGDLFGLFEKAQDNAVRCLFWAAFARLLRTLGYEPELSRCVICGKSNKNQAAYYSPEHGGIICAKDVSKDEHPAKIGAAALAALRGFLTQPLDNALVQNFSDTVYKEIERFVFAFADYHMGLHPNLKSFKFLAQL